MIKQRSDCVINLTTGGAPYMTIEERVRPAATFKPEVASLNMGSMNFGLFPMLNRFKEFKHDWERQALENSRNLVFKNTFQDIEYILRTCAENGTRFEFECYDTSHLYNLAHFLDRGLVQPPLFVQTVFGILGGIGPHPEDVLHMKRTADRLFGDQLPLVGAGRRPQPDAGRRAWRRPWAATSGSGWRTVLVGRPRPLAESNAAQVRRARLILEGLGLEVATPGRGARDPVAQGRRPGGLLSNAADTSPAGIGAEAEELSHDELNESRRVRRRWLRAGNRCRRARWSRQASEVALRERRDRLGRDLSVDATLGKRRFEAALAKLPDDVTVDVHWRRSS